MKDNERELIDTFKSHMIKAFSSPIPEEEFEKGAESPLYAWQGVLGDDENEYAIILETARQLYGFSQEWMNETLRHEIDHGRASAEAYIRHGEKFGFAYGLQLVESENGDLNLFPSCRVVPENPVNLSLEEKLLITEAPDNLSRHDKRDVSYLESAR